MPSPRSVYMIVTNDELEHIVEMDVVGNQACADYLGITLKTLWYRLKHGRWYGKYKAVFLGYENEFDDLEQNENVVILSPDERRERIEQQRLKKHIFCIERQEKKNDERHLKDKQSGVANERARNYYARHKQEISEREKLRRKQGKHKRMHKMKEWCY